MSSWVIFTMMQRNLGHMGKYNQNRLFEWQFKAMFFFFFAETLKDFEKISETAIIFLWTEIRLIFSLICYQDSVATSKCLD